MTTIETFTGFPAEGVQFLRDLEQNNNKTWFEAHKTTYHDMVQTPALALVVALGEALRAEFPRITYDARSNGGSLMRIYRDTRFSADKTPYKTNVAMMFTPEGYKRMEAPGFGLQITSEQVELVAGVFAFTKPQLDIYREAVVDDARGKALIEAVDRLQSADGYTIGGQELKQVPRGYDSSHPRADWLKHKGLPVYAPPIPVQVIHTDACLDIILGHFRNMSPLYQWLMQSLAI